MPTWSKRRTWDMAVLPSSYRPCSCHG
jgi:hypothetical protein